MGQCGGHLGSIPYRRLPSRPSGKASPETSWKTPASVASSRQEPLTGGGGNELSCCGSLRSPPEGTLTWVLTLTRSSFPIYPVPETDYRHRCLSLTLAYLSCSLNNLFAKSCFAMQPFLSVSSMYDLDCLLDSESPPPAYFNHICLVYCLPRVFAASPDHKPELWLWFCLAYVVFEACVWTLPVWLALCIIKAAHGSSRLWLRVTAMNT